MSSPPRLGGVYSPKAHTGWSISLIIDTGEALLDSVRFANIYKVAARHRSTTPPLRGTPPNLGGEFAHSRIPELC